MSKLLKKAAQATVETAPTAGDPLAIFSQTPKSVELFDLTLIGDSVETQTRVGLNMAKVAEYAEDMRAAPDTFGGFPAIVLVEDVENSRYWLSRGHHRVAAAKLAKLPSFPAKVYVGTKRDALLLGVGNNADHGLKRTREDARKEIDLFLTDPDWSTWSDGEIARLCKVSRGTVTNRRKALVEAGTVEEQTERTYRDRYGNVITMQTDGIAESNASRARVPLTDDEARAVIVTELHRRVTSGRIVDKLNWVQNHRRFSYYTAIIADGRTSDDATFDRVAAEIIADLDEQLQALHASNERKAAAAAGRYVAPEPPAEQATEDEQIGLKVHSDKLALWSHMRQLGKLLDDAAPLLRELLANCPADFAASVSADDVDRLIDLATVARAVAARNKPSA